VVPLRWEEDMVAIGARRRDLCTEKRWMRRELFGGDCVMERASVGRGCDSKRVLLVIVSSTL